MRFAYLIMAHNNEMQLKTLIDALDYPENTIYLHIDKKSKINLKAFDTKKARLYVYRRFSVYWGDLSQTKCQFFLLEEAIKGNHDYYHLISGQDFPIKPHSEILSFFERNNGKQFIHFESKEYCEKETCRYRHYLFPLASRCKTKTCELFLKRIEGKMINRQKKKGYGRKLYCGANWYSITHDFAKEFCSRQKELMQLVRWTISSDEYVLQTFYRTMAKEAYTLYGETEGPTDYHATAREIDWHRGCPYVWRTGDYDYLAQSDRMFARKFDSNIDEHIIKRIYTLIKEI